LGGDVGGAGATGAATNNSFGNGVMPMETTPIYNHLPMKGYKLFDSGIDKKGLGKVLQKIREFNDSDAISNATDSRQLKPNESIDLLNSLSNTLATTNRYHSSTVSNAELNTLSKMITAWGASHSFPALDLARMTVLHPDAAREDRRGYWEEVLNGALDTCLGLGSEGMGKEVAVPMLTMRLLANSYKGGIGSAEAAWGLMDRILECTEGCVPSGNKNVRLSVATVLLNTSSYMHASSTRSSSSAAVRILDIVGNIVGCGAYESEAIVRSLVALGTVLLLPGESGMEAKRVTNERSIGSMLERVASMHGDMAKAVSSEISSILS